MSKYTKRRGSEAKERRRGGAAIRFHFKNKPKRGPRDTDESYGARCSEYERYVAVKNIEAVSLGVKLKTIK